MDYKKIFKSKNTRLRILKLLDFVPDKLMIKIQYRIKTGRKLDLKRPKRFNEKIQWYKLNYRNPLMPICTDKYLVRDYVEKKGLKEILVPLYGVYDDPSEIDFNNLPDEFILKTNNGGGSNSILIQTKENILSKDSIFNDINRWLNEWTVKAGREWNYYNIEKKVICEKLLKDDNPYGLIDYKFYCFEGLPHYIKVAYKDEETDELYNGIYDMEFNLLPYCRNEVKKAETPMKKPNNYNFMIEVCKKLSKDFPHVRVDLYNIKGKIYFGELTFFDTSGYQIFTPDEFDFILGEKFDLESITKKRND